MEDFKIQRWDALIPELLRHILRRLSFQELLTVIPCVCKSWRETVMGSYCWEEIDIVEWSKFRNPNQIGRMLEMLFLRSAGSLRRLAVYDIPCESFSLLSVHGKALHTLVLFIPSSGPDLRMVDRVFASFSALSCLNLTSCYYIGAPVIEVIGKCCSNLTEFCRNLYNNRVIAIDDEALAIASTMHKLKRLVIGMPITAASAVKILENCRDLELLDLHNSFGVKLDGELIKRFSTVSIIQFAGVNSDYDQGFEYDDYDTYVDAERDWF